MPILFYYGDIYQEVNNFGKLNYFLAVMQQKKEEKHVTLTSTSVSNLMPSASVKRLPALTLEMSAHN